MCKGVASLSLLADCSGGAGSRTAKAWRKATAAVSHSLRRLQDAQAHAKGILSLARGVHAGIDLRNVQQFARTAQLRVKRDGTISNQVIAGSHAAVVAASLLQASRIHHARWRDEHGFIFLCCRPQ